MILKIAWGSLRRHGRRSLLIVLAIAISVATMEFLSGVMSGMREDFFETMVSSGGHLQVEHIEAEDALDPTSLELLIPDWSELREWFLEQEEVVRAEPVLTFGALVVKDGTNAPMIGYGILPDTGFFSDVRGGISEGRFLTSPEGATAPESTAVTTTGTLAIGTTVATASVPPPEPHVAHTVHFGLSPTVQDSPKNVFLSSPSPAVAASATDSEEVIPVDDVAPREILISTEISDMLDLSLGDQAMILVEDSTGAPYYLDYNVVGIFRSDSGEFDESSFLVSHTDAQDLLYVGDATREIRVTLTDDTLAAPVADRFADAFGVGRGAVTDRRGTDPPITVRTWREIQGGIVVLIEMFDIFMVTINLLIVIVAATVITNAILMNVFEKTKEYGMMRAIGLKNRGVIGLVLAEGTAYGVAGSIAGLAIGMPLVVYFQTHGIDFGEVMESFGMGREITTTFDPKNSVINALFGALTAFIGSLYAALVSQRRTIIESMRGTA